MFGVERERVEMGGLSTSASSAFSLGARLSGKVAEKKLLISPKKASANAKKRAA